MTYDSLRRGNELLAQIKQKEEFLKQLQKDRVVVTLSFIGGSGSVTITTIGTEHGSEHELASQGREMVNSLIILTEQEIGKLQRAFQDLK